MSCQEFEVILGLSAFIKALGVIYQFVYLILTVLFIFGDSDLMTIFSIKLIDKDLYSDKIIYSNLFKGVFAGTMLLTISLVIKDLAYTNICYEKNPKNIMLGFAIGLMTYLVLFYFRMFINWLTKPKTKNAL
mgnify:CR=1 FL=1